MKKNNFLFGVVIGVCLLIFVFVIISIFFISSEVNIKLNKDVFLSENISVFFIPDVSNVDELSNLVSGASTEVNCLFRSLNYEKFENVLSDLEAKGVKVRLAVDSDYLGNKRIYLPYVKFIDLGERGMMHSNYCVIDDSVVFTGSLILNENTLNVNVHDFVFINSSELARRYSSDFWKVYQESELVSRTVSLYDLNEDKYSVVFCPYESCESAVIEIIDGAEESVYFAIYSFTNSEIKKALARAKSRGVDVKGILEKEGVSDDHSLFYDDVEGIYLDVCRERIHTKMWVIDNKYVLTGSFNPSRNAVEYNLENILLIKDEAVADFYLKKISDVLNSCSYRERFLFS